MSLDKRLNAGKYSWKSCGAVITFLLGAHVVELFFLVRHTLKLLHFCISQSVICHIVLDKPTLQRSMFPKNLWLQAYLNQNNYTAIISYGNSLLLHNSSFTIGSEISLKLDGFVPCFFYTIQRSYIQKKKNLHLNQNAIPKIKNSTNKLFWAYKKMKVILK